MTSAPQSIRVSEYLGLVNFALREVMPQGMYIEGEVAQLRTSQNKWAYFDLKDEETGELLPCFSTVFSPGVQDLVEGMRIRVRGYAKVYEKNGKFSLTVQEAIPTGEGALRKAFEQLLNRLTKEGVFETSRKRALPSFPNRIGLITSKDAAAYGDFLRVLGNRWGGIKIVHADVQVQGAQAVESICQAFQTFNNLAIEELPEVLVLTRGGGSMEDLHAFNDERVVRAIYASRIPVIVGVGHERDETLADYVADVRASTPSNAAERLVPHKDDVARDVLQTEMFITTKVEQMVAWYSQGVVRHTQSLDQAFQRTRERVQMQLERFLYGADTYRSRMVMQKESLARQVMEIEHLIENVLQKMHGKIREYEAHIKGADPRKILLRGYAIVKKGGRVIKDPAVLQSGDLLSIEVAKGEIDVAVVKQYKQSRLLE